MKLPDSFTAVTTLSKSLALILFIILPFAGFFLGNKYANLTNVCPIPQPAIVVSLPSTVPTTLPYANWATFENEEYGISFKYPQSLGEPSFKFTDYDKETTYSHGKAIVIAFSGDTGIYLNIHTDDYENMPFAKPNSYQVTCNDETSSNCKNIKETNGNWVLTSKLVVAECTPAFYTEMYLRNPNGDFKNITLGYLSEKLLNIINYSCIDPVQEELAFKSAQNFSKQIITGTISDPEVRSSLDTIKNIAATFRITK